MNISRQERLANAASGQKRITDYYHSGPPPASQSPSTLQMQRLERIDRAQAQVRVYQEKLSRFTEEYREMYPAAAAFVGRKVEPMLRDAMLELDKIRRNPQLSPWDPLAEALMEWDLKKGNFTLCDWRLTDRGTLRFYSKIWKWGKLHAKNIEIQSLRANVFRQCRHWRPGAQVARYSPPTITANEVNPTLLSAVATTFASTETLCEQSGLNNAQGYSSTGTFIVKYNGNEAELFNCERERFLQFPLKNEGGIVFAVSADEQYAYCCFPTAIVRVELEGNMHQQRYPIDPKYHKTHPGVIEMSSNLLVFGGTDSRTCHRCEFTPIAMRTEAIAPMHEERSDFQPCYYRNKVYLVGGGSRLCEVYCPTTESMRVVDWSLPPLAMRIHFASVCGDAVYFGEKKDDKTTLYRTNFSFTELTPFSHDNGYLGVIVVNGVVYFGTDECVVWSSGTHGYETRLWATFV